MRGHRQAVDPLQVEGEADQERPAPGPPVPQEGEMPVVAGGSHAKAVATVVKADERDQHQVEVRLLRKFAQPVTLETLREHATGPLRDLIVLRRGNRLSVMPVTADEWKFIHRLARERPA